MAQKEEGGKVEMNCSKILILNLKWYDVPLKTVVSTHMVTLFLIKEARIYNGEKTASSISGAGKTGQLHVNE